MTFINHSTREVNCKIVYFGCGLSGKTTNLQLIYDRTTESARGSLISLSHENERTLFFDFLPLDAGEVRGFKTRFHLYTIPGQSIYEVSRQFLLKGVDGIVFVLDSQRERLEDNIESYESLKGNLEAQGYDIKKIPMVFQFNKRDLPTSASLEELSQAFNSVDAIQIEAVANKGIGVFETLNEITKKVLLELKGGM